MTALFFSIHNNQANEDPTGRDPHSKDPRTDPHVAEHGSSQGSPLLSLRSYYLALFSTTYCTVAITKLYNTIKYIPYGLWYNRDTLFKKTAFVVGSSDGSPLYLALFPKLKFFLIQKEFVKHTPVIDERIYFILHNESESSSESYDCC